jgi:integrase
MASLSDCAGEYLRWVGVHHRPATLHCYQTPIRSFLSFFPSIPLADVRPRDIDRYAEWEGRLVAPRSLRLYLVVVRAMFSTFVRWGYVQVNPVQTASLPRLPRTAPTSLSPEQARGMIDSLRFADPSLRGAVATALYAGLRRGELAALEWEDITAETILVRNKPTHLLKDFEDRSVPTHPDLESVLRDLPKRACWCFPAHHGGRWHLSDLSVHAARAGVPGFHILRRTFATSCLRAGVDIRTVQRWLGHASLSTTELYLASGRPDEPALIRRLAY